MTPSSRTIEGSPSIDIYNGSEIHAITFSLNGKYLMTGDEDGVAVWRVEDGEQMATMSTDQGSVHCLALSKDGRSIAAGTSSGVIVWDAKTYERVFTLGRDNYVVGVDFAPDSAQLVVALFNTWTAIILDVAHHEQPEVPTLCHEGQVIAAKYSPQGYRIATATHGLVRIWDSSDGRLLVDIKVDVTPEYNNGLLWSNDHLFVISCDAIKQFEASTGSALSECQVPDSVGYSCIALLQHEECFGYSTSRTIIFSQLLTNTQLALVHYSESLFFMAFSPDDRSLAIGGRDGRITVKRLSHINEPEIQIDSVALNLWKKGQLANAEASLNSSRGLRHHVLASRALVRARLQHWDAALVDAEMAINIQPCVIGYIAKSIALVGKGERQKGYQACDIAFERFHSSHVSFLLLIKAIIMFMAGQHRDAISRIDDLIATIHFNSTCYVVQSYMYLLLGNSQMGRNDYEGAIQSFEHAQVKLRHLTSRLLLVVSLISGWKFDGLDIMIRQRLCEALYAAGRTKDASESFLKNVNMFDREIYAGGTTTKWISEFTQRCLSTPEIDNNATSNTTRHGKTLTLRATPIPLLREWAKATLVTNAWNDALVAAASFVVPRFTTYRIICERLEAMDRITDASDCFCHMVDELLQQVNVHVEQAEWVLGKLESLADTAMSAGRVGDAISHYSTALALHPAAPQDFFIKRSEAYIARGLWKEALKDANKVIELDPSSPRGYERKYAALYRAVDYENAICAFEAMPSMSAQSPDLDTLEDPALGQLLAQLLTSSGDTSILAWTGKSGSFNSCLPANVAVFNEPTTSHIPRTITKTEMEMIVAKMRASSLNLTLVMLLYDRLHGLPFPMLLRQRMKLPCLTFKLGLVSATRSASRFVFRANTDALGTVEIKTTEDLSRLNSLILVHPWIDYLLNRRPVEDLTETIRKENSNDQSSQIGRLPSFPDPSITQAVKQSRMSHLVARLGRPLVALPQAVPPQLAHPAISLMDKQTQALQVIARLKQPFGALLLAPAHQNASEYRRVTSESLIIVQVRGDTPLKVLIAKARVLDMV